MNLVIYFFSGPLEKLLAQSSVNSHVCLNFQSSPFNAVHRDDSDNYFCQMKSITLFLYKVYRDNLCSSS